MPELILILVVALLIFGPTKLPELARSLGKGLAEFRRASSDLRSQLLDPPIDPPPRPDPKPAAEAAAQSAVPEGAVPATGAGGPIPPAAPATAAKAADPAEGDKSGRSSVG